MRDVTFHYLLKHNISKRTYVRYCMLIISAVKLVCCDKFEETPNEKVINMSKLTKLYFYVLFTWQNRHK